MQNNPLLGQKLGKYEIVDIIGQGGMATVFKGYQADIDRYVAVKVLPPHPAQDLQFGERFQQEARTIARLQHPHILPMFDYGQQEGILYLVMPYVASGSLKRVLADEGPFAPRRVADLLMKIASALDYAHRQQLVHRDIKPDNILIDEDGNPLLTDFGIAKILQGGAYQTATGGFLGTPAYMAPEQGRGIRDLDGRADQYALGVLAYEMLTGMHPYQAETPMMVMFKHVSDPVPSLKSTRFPLADVLDPVLQRALAKDREERFPTTQAFAEAFQRVLNQAHVHADSSPTATGFTPPAKPLEGETLVGTAETLSPSMPSSVKTDVPPARPAQQGLWFGLGAVFLLALLIGGGLLLSTGGEVETDSPTATLQANNPINSPVATSATPRPQATRPPTMVAQAPSLPVLGQVTFATTSMQGDTAALTLPNLAPAPAGLRYQAWLVRIKEANWRLFGEVTPDADGRGQVFLLSTDENLHTLYDAVVISLETDDEMRGDAPKGEIIYSGVLPTAVSEAFYQIFMRWTPPNSTINPDGLSLYDILKGEYTFAEDHANRTLQAAKRGFVPGMRLHAEHVYNILEGSNLNINNEDVGASQGYDNNNPSTLQIGLIPALMTVNELLFNAAESAVLSPDSLTALLEMQTCVDNALFWSQDAFERAVALANAQQEQDFSTEVNTWYNEILVILQGQDVDQNGEVQALENECGIEGLLRHSTPVATLSLREGLDPALAGLLPS